ncbi:MAG TPA: M23 family metallopeptidase, partial [Candidatus Limnocylindrales bacterium]
HWAIDIAADYGSTVVAAAAGKVIFAGWKSNGGGWQVWISHGGNMFTTYNHMSAITVGTGESVGRGQQVGRIGQSGDATGPHLHFEVWIGPIWNGGQRMNPLNYL